MPVLLARSVNSGSSTVLRICIMRHIYCKNFACTVIIFACTLLYFLKQIIGIFQKINKLVSLFKAPHPTADTYNVDHAERSPKVWH